MSQTTPTSNFRTIFVAAMKAYEKKTKTDLLTHPLATQLQSCNSSSDILAVLHETVNKFDESRNHNERLSSWLNPTINVLYAFSATLGGGVGLVRFNRYASHMVLTESFSQIFSPANVISAGVGVLLLVSILLGPFMKGFSTSMSVRPPRISTRVKKRLPISSSASKTSLNALNHTRKCHLRTR
jgi:hypothetical protein